MSQPTSIKPTSPKNKRQRANGQGTISWDAAKKRYHAQIFDIHKVRRGKTFKTKKAAEEWLDEMKQDRKLGQSGYSINSKTTMSEFIDQWLMVKKSTLAPETYRSYFQLTKNHIKPAIGHIKVKEFDAGEIDTLIGSLIEKGYGPGTIQAVYATIRACFKHALKKKKITIDPMACADRPNLKSKSNKHIPKHDFQKIYEVASLNPYMHARIEIGMIVGLRPSEIYGLKWADIDFETQTISVERQIQWVKGQGLVERTVKTDTSRTVPISIETINILKTHKAFQNMSKGNWIADHGLIFPNTIGNPLDRNRDLKWWRDVLTRAGVPNYTLYQMRKSAFTYMASLVSVPSLLQYTGHTNVATVMKHYAFATNEELALGLSRMNELRSIRDFSYSKADSGEAIG